MDRLLATILSVGYNWNRREFRRFRNCALALTVLPLGMLVGAAALGGVAWLYKLIAIELAWLLVLYATIVFGWRRLPFVVEVGTLLAASDPKAKDRGLSGDIRVSVTEYLQLVMAVLASETAAGFITLWLPVHANVPLALLGLPIGMAFIAYWIWQQGEAWWPRLVWWLTFFTAIFALVGLTAPYYFPHTTSEVVSGSGRFDSGLAAFIRGQATPQTVFWVMVVLLLVWTVLPLMFKKKPEARSVAHRALLFLIAALLVSWFVWGSGWATAKEWSGKGPAVTLAGKPQLHLIKLDGADTPVEVDRIPLCWRWTLGWRGLRGPLKIQFTNGTTETAYPEDSRNWPSHLYPKQLSGEKGGVVELELYPKTHCGAEKEARRRPNPASSS